MPPKGAKAGKAPPAGKGKAAKPVSPVGKPKSPLFKPKSPVKAKASIRIVRRPKVDLTSLPPPEPKAAVEAPPAAQSAQAAKPSATSAVGVVDRKVTAPKLLEPPYLGKPTPFAKDHAKAPALLKDDAKAKPPAKEEPKAKPRAREDEWGEPPAKEDSKGKPPTKEDAKAASPASAASAESLRRVASFNLPLPPPLPKPKAPKKRDDDKDGDEDEDGEDWAPQALPEADAEQRRRAEEVQNADRERRVREREISRGKPDFVREAEAFLRPSLPEGPRAEAKRRKVQGPPVRGPQAGRAETAVGHPQEPAESALKPDDVRRLLERLKPEAQIDDAACKVISLMADRMLDDVVRKAARLASHRGAKALQARDINFVLEEEWGLKQRKDD